jgi:flavin-dependent dehydrogenase
MRDETVGSGRPAPTEAAYECDVLVIGSGAAGYCAAIQAGRSGCRTILIEKDPVLGGNSGPMLGVGITGADRFAHYAAETGIIHEIQEEGAWIEAWGVVRSGAYTISRRFEALVQNTLEAAGVTVLKSHYAREPVMDGRRILGDYLLTQTDLEAGRRFDDDFVVVGLDASPWLEFAAALTERLRLRVLATHGEGQGARVYSVAAYAE